MSWVGSALTGMQNIYPSAHRLLRTTGAYKTLFRKCGRVRCLIDSRKIFKSMLIMHQNVTNLYSKLFFKISTINYLVLIFCQIQFLFFILHSCITFPVNKCSFQLLQLCVKNDCHFPTTYHKVSSGSCSNGSLDMTSQV